MVNRNGSNNGHSNGTGNGLVPVNGNGHDAALDATHHELLWDGLPPAVTNALGQPLDPALVSQRKGRAGRTYDYLEGHVVIDQANRIFGFGGWGYELAGDVTLRQIENVDTKTGEVKTTSFYSAPVRVTVAGAPPRTDIGFNAVAEDNADGHETAIKGAVTDGMKRALRSFGVQLGNGFYGDQPAEEAGGRRTVARQTGGNGGGASRPQRAPAQAKAASGPANAPALRKRLIEIAAEQGFDEAGVRSAVTDRTGKSLDALDASELAPLVEAAAKKLQETQSGEGGLARPAHRDTGIERGRLLRGRPRFLIYRTRRTRAMTHDAHTLGLDTGHRGAGRGRLAGIHRQPRRAEAQPGAVELAAPLRPGRNADPDLRGRGLRGSHRQDAAGSRRRTGAGACPQGGGLLRPLRSGAAPPAGRRSGAALPRHRLLGRLWDGPVRALRHQGGGGFLRQRPGQQAGLREDGGRRVQPDAPALPGGRRQAVTTTTRARPRSLPSTTTKLSTEMGNLYVTVSTD